jgi:hypothetical protein
MADETATWRTVEYEGFEIHVSPVAKQQPSAPFVATAPHADEIRYTYLAYVCHPGADPRIPGHAVPFHADGDESFASEDDAFHEAVHVGRSIVDGTHPDLTVLPLVTGGV